MHMSASLKRFSPPCAFLFHMDNRAYTEIFPVRPELVNDTSDAEQQSTPAAFEVARANDDINPELSVDSMRLTIQEIFSRQSGAAETPRSGVLMAATPVESEVLSIKESLVSRKTVTRKASLRDIPSLVDLDMKMYRRLYELLGMDKEVRRAEVEGMLSSRFKNAGEWMFIAEVNGRVEGFVSAVRTNKGPEEFSSWEESTNHGTLDGVQDNDGENLYLVNLTASPRAMKEEGHLRMLGLALSHMIEQGVDQVYFESRMPLFRKWLERSVREKGLSIEEISQDEVDLMAQEYFNSKTIFKGEEVPLDPELRLYESMGVKFERLIRSAFEDPQSMNYGVLCTFENPLPKSLRKGIINKVAGKIGRKVLAHPRIADLIIR